MVRRALVTGCCGFIGSELVKALHARGWAVEGVDDLSHGDLGTLSSLNVRPVHVDFFHVFSSKANVSSEQVLVVTGDFAHDVILSRIKSGHYDVVFHLAAVADVAHSTSYPVETHEINVFKTLALFQACAENVESVMFASSAAVYGNPSGDTLYLKEDHACRPTSPYGIQKLHAEHYAEYLASSNTTYTSLRIFNVFGPGQESGVIAKWCANIRDNLPLIINGEGNQTRDFCYIDNVVDAFLACETNSPNVYNVYNVGSGVSISLNDVLHHLKNMFPNITLRYDSFREGDIFHSLADVTKINKELNYNPKAQFLYGLNETLKWWGMYV